MREHAPATMARDMLAVFCTGKHAIEVRETDMPRPGPGEVLVRVRACGICGSDLHFYNGAFPAMAGISPGHEFCGEVAEAGEGVSGFRAGDRVVVEPIRSCRSVYCRTGQYQICPKHALLGTFVPGGLAGHHSAGLHLYRLPEALDWNLGAITEPWRSPSRPSHRGPGAGRACACHGKRDHRPAVSARGEGCGRGEVIATYRTSTRGGALAAGADRALRDGETAGLEKESIDVVVETVGGTAPTLSQALGIVRPGGRISVLGLFTQSVQMNALGLMLKEVKMTGGITYCRPGQHSTLTRRSASCSRSRTGRGPSSLTASRWTRRRRPSRPPPIRAPAPSRCRCRDNQSPSPGTGNLEQGHGEK
jgi:(R,R)-butanediol dehydrogenase/meso-butanediol dehydrogenase/diacetyl reductase